MHFHWAQFLSFALLGNFSVFTWRRNTQIQLLKILYSRIEIYLLTLIKVIPLNCEFPVIVLCQVFVQASALTMKTRRRICWNIFLTNFIEIFWSNVHRIRMSNCSKASLNALKFVYLLLFHAFSNRSLTHRRDLLLRNIQLKSSQQISC